MGRPYATELASLPATYAEALDHDICHLASAVASTTSFPLLAAGSGGSLTGAHLAALLHQTYTGRVAKAVTPLEIVSSPLISNDLAILIMSAEGTNHDIVGAFAHIVAREPRSLVVLCRDPRSPLSDLASGFRYVHLVTPATPPPKDGFLAVNSLLAFSVMLIRAYEQVSGGKDALPDFASLVHPGQTVEQFADEIRRRCRPLWDLDTLVVLHGPSTQPAAVDLESKFTEAALGTVQIADYRNFAHGRHHWLAARRDTTAVLALVSDDDRDLANSTLRLLPSDLTIEMINVARKGARASLAALATALYVAGAAGEARGIDPGRPRVASFGRAIYNLRALTPWRSQYGPLSPLRVAALERKAGTSIAALAQCGTLSFWADALAKFVAGIEATSFDAVVFDYDGTLCDRCDGVSGPDINVVQHLVRLLRSGVTVGIATGRGSSIRDPLRKKIDPALWPRIVVGYYNGADIGTLSDDSHPDRNDRPCDVLRPVADALVVHPTLERIARRTCRSYQITLEHESSVNGALVWDIVQQIVQTKAPNAGLGVVRSGHSVDILAPGVSKRALVEYVRNMGASGQGGVLCIGDQGRWPGNDCALLSGPFSLSVDAVSADPDTCWNLAAPGHRGVQALLGYLSTLKSTGTPACVALHLDKAL